MKEFRSIEDVDRANLPDGLREAVRGTLTTLIDAYAEVGECYDPDADGHTVLVERGDTAEVVRAAIGGYTLRDAAARGRRARGEAAALPHGRPVQQPVRHLDHGSEKAEEAGVDREGIEAVVECTNK